MSETQNTIPTGWSTYSQAGFGPAQYGLNNGHGPAFLDGEPCTDGDYEDEVWS